MINFPNCIRKKEGAEHTSIQLNKFLNKNVLERCELLETNKMIKMLFLSLNGS